MATTVKGNKWGVRQPIPTGQGQTSSFVVKSLMAGDGLINSIVKLFQIQVKGIQVNDCFVQCGKLDAGTATVVIDLQLTDGTTTKTLISGSAAGQAGGLTRPTKAPLVEDGIGFVTTNELFWVQAKFTTGMTTADLTALFNVYMDLTGYYPAGSVTE